MDGIDEGSMERHEILSIAAFPGPLRQLVEGVERNVSEPECDLFRACQARALPLLEDLDVLAGLQQRGMGSCVEPSEAAAHDLDEKLSLLHVDAVHVGDLELAPRRRLDRSRNVGDLIVIEIQPSDRVAGFRLGRFLLDRERATVAVEFHHAVAFGVIHRISKHRRASPPIGSAREQLGQAVTVEDVITQHQRHRIAADELAAHDEGVGEAARFVLARIGKAQSEVGAIAQQPLEQRLVFGRRDDQDVANTGEHQRRQGIVDHRLVEHRQELLRNHQGCRVKPGAAASGQDDTFHQQLPLAEGLIRATSYHRVATPGITREILRFHVFRQAKVTSSNGHFTPVFSAPAGSSEGSLYTT